MPCCVLLFQWDYVYITWRVALFSGTTPCRDDQLRDAILFAMFQEFWPSSEPKPEPGTVEGSHRKSGMCFAAYLAIIRTF